MRSTPFDPDKDRAPIPFDQTVCELARALKAAGLPWHPRVGCFVWDPDHIIEIESPFPNRVYFILNLGQFERILGSGDMIRNKLVWLPTLHQIRQLLNEYQIPVSENLKAGDVLDTSKIYQLLLDKIRRD